MRCGVKTILRDAAGVTIIDANGESARYDGVIIASHADQALAMLDDASAEERNLLGSIRYRPNKAVLHCDPLLMPKRRMTWASWNYLGHTDDKLNDDLCVTYWMNKLQNIDHRAPLFVTLNPRREPRGVLHEVTFQHPQLDRVALAAQAAVPRLPGPVQFAGAHLGFGFHEDGMRAGEEAAARIEALRLEAVA